MRLAIVVVTGMFIIGTARAQDCPSTLTGEVKDISGAVIVGARVTLDKHRSATTDEDGRVTYRCVSAGKHSLRVEADSFATQDLSLEAGKAIAQIKMKPATLQQTVDATAGGVDATDDVAGAKTLSTTDLSAMADDPDDFQQQLQALAAMSGGSPGAATITVDGFQGGSRLPPKSAIAFIRINPDLFSAEYAQPPYEGGRIEVYTKPGQDKVHGALFMTYGGPALNARNPFALTHAATGKRRYGFELTGPLVSKKSDFVLDFEKRDIDESAVVNAVTLDATGNQIDLVQNVPTPQRLWIGSVRLGFQVGPKTNATLSYTANVNNLQNLGVGGTSLLEAGFDNVQSEYALRGTAMTNVSPDLVHEARASFQWRDLEDTPHSAAVGVLVSGAFVGGGAGVQALRSYEKNIEIDDDALWNHKKHMSKFGVELTDSLEHLSEPTNFNGSYTFSGAVAPVLDSQGRPVAGQVTRITALEQYRRALLGLAGGAATTYSQTSGDPEVDFNQLHVAFYAQDQWKLKPRLQMAFGMRYAVQTSPGTYANFAPRAGVSWAPDKKQAWILRARTGLFSTPITTATTMQTLRLDGQRQKQTVLYGASFGNPSAAGTASVQTLRRFAPTGVSQNLSSESQLAIEHDFPRHWHAQANLYLVTAWDSLRSQNVNAPLNGDPSGPRPGMANSNIFEYQQTGRLHGNVTFVGIDQHSMKRFQIFAAYLRMDLRGNADAPDFSPQSNSSDAGETARPVWESTHRVLAFGQLNLPWKLSLSEQMNLASGTPYNVVTGGDNNGDGVFNDRPQYASGPGAGVYSTSFGLLTVAGGTGVLPRNAGTMPWTMHLDLNMARTFNLTKGKEHPQTLALNARAANVLNHTNVTAVGGVLGSPFFGRPYAAEPGRRIEFGARYSF